MRPLGSVADAFAEMAYNGSMFNELTLMALQADLQALHASDWMGVLEEVGTGGGLSVLLQAEAGASQTLWASYCHYHRQAQAWHYGSQQAGSQQGRAVSRERVESWAQHNFEQALQAGQSAERLFSLAISGAVSSGTNTGDAHAWLCLQVAAQRWSLHLRCLEPERLLQQQAIALLGLHLLLQLATTGGLSVARLPAELKARMQIDVWLAQPCLQGSYLPQTLLLTEEALALLSQGWTPLVLLQPQSGPMGALLLPVRPLELTRGQHLLLHKGAFNPVTRAHLAMIERVQEQLPGCQPVLEIALSNLDKGQLEPLNLAHRLAMLAFQPWPVALTTTPALYQTREDFAHWGQAAQVDFVCGEDLYQRVFLSKYYSALPAGIAEGLERLFAGQTRLWVLSRENDIDFPPEAASWQARYAEQCKLIAFDMPMASSSVRAQIAAGDLAYREQLQPEVFAYLERFRPYT